MGLTKEQRRTMQLPAQCEVALGAIPDLQAENGGRYFTSAQLAEALTYAQEEISPQVRIPTPVDSRTAGQYLGYLHSQGYVEPRMRGGLTYGVWRLTEKGQRESGIPGLTPAWPLRDDWS